MQINSFTQSVFTIMGRDRKIEEAIKSGERNRDTMELVQNWCANAKIIRHGGIGLVEAQTGLPIGHFGLQCDYAPAGGSMTWDLRDAAVQFHNKNCVNCLHRKPVGIPNLSGLVAKVDEERHRRLEMQEAHEAKEAKRLSERKAVRAELRTELSAISATIIDQLEELDTNGSEEIRVAFIKTATVAPEAFTAPIINHFCTLIEQRELWFVSAGLAVLKILKSDPVRLVNCAMLCLIRHDSVELAAEVVEENISILDVAKVKDVVHSLINLANPAHQPFSSFDQVRKPVPLLTLQNNYPNEVQEAIKILLESRSLHLIEVGARGIQVLAVRMPETAKLNARQLAALLARAKWLVDEDETRFNDDKRDLHEVKKALVLAFQYAPATVDEMVWSYYDGAPSEGQARLVDVYRHVLLDDRTNEKFKAHDSHVIALRRLVDVATKADEYEVLSTIQEVFHGEPLQLSSVVQSNSDILLGAVAVVDGRIDDLDSKPLIAQGAAATMERENVKQMLRMIFEGMIDWVANSAAGNQVSMTRFVDFYNAISDGRENLKSSLLLRMGSLMSNPFGINAALPSLYSAIVGGSTVMRGSAIRALSKLRHRAIRDIPDLMFEVLVVSLYDTYVYVHQAALEALDELELPEDLQYSGKMAVQNLLLVYAQDKSIANRSDFLLRCIDVYLNKFASEKDISGVFGQFCIEKLLDQPSSRIARKLPLLGRKLAQFDTYAKLLANVYLDQEAREYDRERVMRAINELHLDALQKNSAEFYSLGKSLIELDTDADFIIETLTKACAWREAADLADLAYKKIPANARLQRLKLESNLTRIATEFESAIARDECIRLEGLAKEWELTLDAIQKMEG